MTFCIIDSTKGRLSLTGVGVGLEHRSSSLPLGTDYATHLAVKQRINIKDWTKVVVSTYEKQRGRGEIGIQ